MKGVWGKILKVDLTHGTCKAESLPGNVYEYFLGGAGMAAYYMWKECPAGTTAFNPANRLTFAGGPMTGLKQTGAAKWTAGAISPSINMNADSAATASFGIEMKETGFDAIVVYGRSAKPVTWSWKTAKPGSKMPGSSGEKTPMRPRTASKRRRETVSRS